MLQQFSLRHQQKFSSFTHIVLPGSLAVSLVLFGSLPAKSYAETPPAAPELSETQIAAPLLASPTPAPGNLQVAPGNTQATLSWDAPTFETPPSEVSYTVEISEDSGSSWSIVASATIDTSQLLSGLRNGVNYSVRVTTLADGVPSDPSAPITVQAIGEPSQPQLLSAAPDNGHAVLSWDAPASDGGAAIHSYTLEMTADQGASWSVAAVLPATARSVDISSLNNGTIYYFRLAASNSIGVSLTTPALRVVPRTVAAAPRGITVTPSNGQVTLSWAQPGNTGGAIITDYRIEHSADGTNWTEFVHAPSPATVATLTGLSNGVSYSFRISSVNAAGTGAPSSPVSAAPVGPPTAPTLNSLTLSTGIATLSWSAPVNDGGSPITGYTVERFDAASTQWVAVQQLSASQRNAVVPVAAGDTHTSFRVFASNLYGTSTPSEQMAGTTPPIVPTVQLTVKAEQQSVVLNWVTTNDSAGMSPATVWLLSEAGSWKAVGTTSSSTYRYSALQPSTQYTFKVSRTAPGAGTIESNTVSATVLALPEMPPTDTSDIDETPAADLALTVTQRLATEARLSWSSDAVPAHAHIVFERSDTAGATWHRIDTAETSRSTLLLTDLEPYRGYDIRATVVSDTGSTLGRSAAQVAALPEFSVPATTLRMLPNTREKLISSGVPAHIAHIDLVAAPSDGALNSAHTEFDATGVAPGNYTATLNYVSDLGIIDTVTHTIEVVAPLSDSTEFIPLTSDTHSVVMDPLGAFAQNTHVTLSDTETLRTSVGALTVRGSTSSDAYAVLDLTHATATTTSGTLEFTVTDDLGQRARVTYVFAAPENSDAVSRPLVSHTGATIPSR